MHNSISHNKRSIFKNIVKILLFIKDIMHMLEWRWHGVKSRQCCLTCVVTFWCRVNCVLLISKCPDLILTKIVLPYKR